MQMTPFKKFSILFFGIVLAAPLFGQVTYGPANGGSEFMPWVSVASRPERTTSGASENGETQLKVFLNFSQKLSEGYRKDDGIYIVDFGVYRITHLRKFTFSYGGYAHFGEYTPRIRTYPLGNLFFGGAGVRTESFLKWTQPNFTFRYIGIGLFGSYETGDFLDARENADTNFIVNPIAGPWTYGFTLKSEFLYHFSGFDLGIQLSYGQVNPLEILEPKINQNTFGFSFIGCFEDWDAHLSIFPNTLSGDKIAFGIGYAF